MKSSHFQNFVRSINKLYLSNFQGLPRMQCKNKSMKKYFNLSKAIFSNSKCIIIGVENCIHMPGVIPVYTDGSCINNGKPNAISSIGVFFPTQTKLYFYTLN